MTATSSNFTKVTSDYWVEFVRIYDSNGDGVLQLDACAGELVHESFTCDTRDHEDHTWALSHALCPPHHQLPCPTARRASTHSLARIVRAGSVA